jgi:biotin-dependent carboxylase-like uncharacterized protein
VGDRTIERAVEVLEPGLQTTVQDAGRFGYLKNGTPPAGAQDNHALRLASVLVGNALPPPPFSLGYPGDAGLEIPLLGPKLRFSSEAVIAVAGAEMPATLDDEPIPPWESVLVPAGSVLALGPATCGMRCYVAIAGGIDVPLYLGSRSTYVRGSQGGLEGRALRTGDVLPLGEPRRPLPELAGRRVRATLIPRLGPPWELRVVLGPQAHLFTEGGIETFLTTDWQMSPVSDRMGFRFVGPPLALRERPAYLIRDAGQGPADIVDDVIPVGGIQVPGGIEPIAMGVENPTAGGYAKIATVISADLGRLGQIRPGQTTRFVDVDLDEALAIGAEQAASANEDALVTAA